MSSSASEFGKDMGLMHEVVLTGRKCGFTPEDWGVLAHNEEMLRHVLSLIRGEAELVFKPKVVSAAKLEIDPIIRPDRSMIIPNYPVWVQEVMHPDLEAMGPAEYSVTDVEQWLHEEQKNGKRIRGIEIYRFLTVTADIVNHLGLRDLQEIQKKGIRFFRRYFKSKIVLGWKGVVRDRSDLYVPCIFRKHDEVVEDWFSLNYVFHGKPGLRHASRTH